MKFVICIALCMLLFSCASTKNSSQDIKLFIEIGADANPNTAGRPSPVALNLLSLTERNRFLSADYLALVKDIDKVLLKTLVSRQHIDPVAPGDTLKLTFNNEEKTRFIGIVAELAQFSDAKTHLVLPIDALSDKQPVRIVINRTGIMQKKVQKKRMTHTRFNED